MVQFTLLATVLPLLNPEAHGVAHHTFTFAEYILQSNVINVLVVATGLGFILSKLNIPAKLDGATQKLIRPLQDAQAFRNKTESNLSQLTLKFQTLEQTKSHILQTAEETAQGIHGQLQDKIDHAVHGLSLSYDSKKQRESALLQSIILNEVVNQLFDEVESTLPPLKECHEKLIQLLIAELKDEPKSETPSPQLDPTTA